MGPQNRPRTKISNRYNSKPEIDFVTIPTAFAKVWGHKNVPENFPPGALEGVKLDKVQKGHGFQPPMSRKLVNEFFQKFLCCKGI